MANLLGTTVTGNLAVTGTMGGQGAVPLGGVVAVAASLTGSHTMPGSGAVDDDGWMLCDGSSIPGSQTLSGTLPDLTDGRFIRGATTSGQGGSETFSVAEANLPAHDHGGASGTTCNMSTGNHSADHTHSISTGGQSNQHCHTSTHAGNHNHAIRWRCQPGWDPGFAHSNGGWAQQTNSNDINAAGNHNHGGCCVHGGCSHSHSGTSGGTSANHSHTMNHCHALASVGSGTALSHIPKYFNIKYLIRVI